MVVDIVSPTRSEDSQPAWRHQIVHRTWVRWISYIMIDGPWPNMAFDKDGAKRYNRDTKPFTLDKKQTVVQNLIAFVEILQTERCTVSLPVSQRDTQ